MKLYTEEQLIKAMETALIPPIYRQDLWGHLTPIELPSDDDIDEQLPNGMEGNYVSGFYDGAKWVVNRIEQTADHYYQNIYGTDQSIEENPNQEASN